MFGSHGAIDVRVAAAGHAMVSVRSSGEGDRSQASFEEYIFVYSVVPREYPFLAFGKGLGIDY